MLAHWDFFRFYDTEVVVACDENDTIMGYFVLENENQLHHIWVYPEFRGSNIVHHLVWKAVQLMKERGIEYLWGIMYPNRKNLYENYCKMWGAVMVVVETPEERSDGQWNLRFYINHIDDSKAPKWKEVRHARRNRRS